MYFSKSTIMAVAALLASGVLAAPGPSLSKSLAGRAPITVPVVNTAALDAIFAPNTGKLTSTVDTLSTAVSSASSSITSNLGQITNAITASASIAYAVNANLDQIKNAANSLASGVSGALTGAATTITQPYVDDLKSTVQTLIGLSTTILADLHATSSSLLIATQGETATLLSETSAIKSALVSAENSIVNYAAATTKVLSDGTSAGLLSADSSLSALISSWSAILALY